MNTYILKLTKYFLRTFLFIAFSFTINKTLFSATFQTSGAEVKTAAGAGTTISRGASSIFYNPANLILSKRFEPYIETSILNLKYDYTYPGYDAISVKTTTPLPFLGFSYQPMQKLTFALTFLPIPEGSGKTTIKKLPTREVSETPIVVDVESKGNGLSYVLGTAVAYRLFSNLAIGLSYIRDEAGSQILAKDIFSGAVVYSYKGKTTTDAFRIGSRIYLFSRSLVLGITYKPVATSKSKAEEYKISEPELVKKKSTGKEYSYLSLGAEYEFRTFSPFFEITREFHEELRKNSNGDETDYYDTTNTVFGLKYRFSFTHRLIFAYGNFPSYLGDGLMKERAADGKELNGLKFGNVNGIPRSVYSFGYQLRLPSQTYNFGFSHQQGSCSVGEDSRGYGDYSLAINYLILSASFQVF